jgi:LPXTG-motif cell wall-anchored protein
VVRRFLQVAAVAAVAISLTPVVLAQGGGGCDGCRRPAARTALQGDPRDPFGHDDPRQQQDGGGGGGTTARGGTAAGGRSATAPGGATGTQRLPRTGSTTSALAVAAGLLLAAGGLALWVTRYRPRHAGHRPRHAR